MLLQQRPAHAQRAGYWEFPGGKMEPGESAGAALARELAEELGIRVSEQAPFMRLDHEYPERRVALDFRLVRRWEGEPRALEGQRLQWVGAAALADYRLLEANLVVVDALCARLAGGLSRR